MIKGELNGLYAQLDDIQQKYLDVLRAKMSFEDSAFYRVQMGDMARLIELDIKARAKLQDADSIIDTVELSSSLYAAFLEYMSAILTELSACKMPAEATRAYSAVGASINAGEKLSARDIFACISLTITVVSLCIGNIGIEKQPTLISILDKLLDIKTSQLRLVDEALRFRMDFLPPTF